MPANHRAGAGHARAASHALCVRELLDRVARSPSSRIRRSSARRRAMPTRRPRGASVPRRPAERPRHSIRTYYALAERQRDVAHVFVRGGDVEPRVRALLRALATGGSSGAASQSGSHRTLTPDEPSDEQSVRARRRESRARTHHASTSPTGRLAPPGVTKRSQTRPGEDEDDEEHAAMGIPAAGTSGTSQSTYCGEKHLAERDERRTAAAAARRVAPATQVEPRDRQHRGDRTSDESVATAPAEAADDVLRAGRPVAEHDRVDPEPVEHEEQRAAEALDLEPPLELHPVAEAKAAGPGDREREMHDDEHAGEPDERALDRTRSAARPASRSVRAAGARSDRPSRRPRAQAGLGRALVRRTNASTAPRSAPPETGRTC